MVHRYTCRQARHSHIQKISNFFWKERKSDVVKIRSNNYHKLLHSLTSVIYSIILTLLLFTKSLLTLKSQNSKTFLSSPGHWLGYNADNAGSEPLDSLQTFEYCLFHSSRLLARMMYLCPKKHQVYKTTNIHISEKTRTIKYSSDYGPEAIGLSHAEMSHDWHTSTSVGEALLTPTYKMHPSKTKSRWTMKKCVRIVHGSCRVKHSYL